MPYRRFVSVCVVAVGVALFPANGLSQVPETSAVPQTSWGRPDLQGIWDFRTITPMERPEELADKPTLTEEEAAAFAVAESRRVNRDLINSETGGLNYAAEADGGVVPYNEFWYDRGSNVIGTRRTSLIIDPPNGRFPPFTPDGQKYMDAEREIGREEQRGRPMADEPADRSVGDRCIMGFNAGPPMVPSAYNNNIQLFQPDDYVVILNEMVHNARIIPIDGDSSNLPFSQYSGVSRAHWEGETLVIETDQFKGGSSGLTSPNMHLIERLTRLDPDTVAYEYTVTDPTVYTAPYSVMMPFRRTDGPLFEYACHEGNIGLHGILAGARNLELMGRELRP